MHLSASAVHNPKLSATNQLLQCKAAPKIGQDVPKYRWLLDWTHRLALGYPAARRTLIANMLSSLCRE
jgi:hypothetical protein